MNFRLNRKTFYLNLIFWVGLSSLIYEIFSTKVLFLFFLESSQAVTIAITAFLAGLAFSSLIFSGFARHTTKNNLRIIFLMQIAVIIYGYFILKNYALIPNLIDYLQANINNPGLVNFLKIAIIWIYLFIPAFFIGGSFPLVNGLYLKDHKDETRGTGVVYFWDTLGAIIGAFLAGFWLLPELGFRATVIIAISINLVVAVVIAPKKWIRIGLVAITLALFVTEGIYFKNHHNVKIDTAQGQESSINTYPEYPELDHVFGDVLFQEVSQFGRITIGNNAFGEQGNKTLFINYRDMCRSNFHASEAGMGSLVGSKSPFGSRVLSIGFGCGFTANAIASEKNVSKLDIAEINKTIIKGSGQYFKQENGDVLNNPKTTLNIIDGAEYIRNTQTLYDSVVIDIEEATIIYSSPLYSKEYFQIAKDQMKPTGVFALWAFNGNPNFEKVIYNTLKSVYKNVNLIIIDSMYTFYASDYTQNLPVSRTGNEPTAEELQDTQNLLNTQNDEINTLDNGVLEKYFRVKQIFDLPVNYSEQFLNEKQTAD